MGDIESVYARWTCDVEEDVGFALLSFLITVNAANPGVSLTGVGFVPGTTLDASGLARQPICQLDDSTNCIDQATLGGFGSAVAYTGFNNVFLTVPDRGPFDGRIFSDNLFPGRPTQIRRSPSTALLAAPILTSGVSGS